MRMRWVVWGGGLSAHTTSHAAPHRAAHTLQLNHGPHLLLLSLLFKERSLRFGHVIELCFR